MVAERCIHSQPLTTVQLDLFPPRLFLSVRALGPKFPQRGLLKVAGAPGGMSSAPLPSTVVSAEACHSTIKPVTPGLKPVEGRAPSRVNMRLPGTLRSLRRGAGRTLEIRTAAGAQDARAPALFGHAGQQGRLRAARGRGARRPRRARGRGGGARGRTGRGRGEGGSGEGGAGRLAAAAI